ncbi:hypothetical protein PQ460_22690 [Paenibacillus sp. KACC 21273]|uniref:hypothetical protein n=1 Tax=Paenibacillus sp. KACC 21273 TaxID=3025665 RepID=UPI00236550F2|nr:hypothetical protein [Paenibacillus sp. KACC 21273]WDF50744.1 hypothetical protein PQ460_22690 [Paenibacillus sp. KACC 21273]
MGFFENISRLEHELIIEAELSHGDYFLYLQEISEYFGDYFLKEDNFFNNVEEVYNFKVLYMKLDKMLKLAGLSIIRLHMNQAYMDLRNALELGCLAAYSLVFPETEFVFSNQKSNIDELQKDRQYKEKKLKEKVYKWLAESFPEHSKVIKHNKDLINQNVAHGNAFDAHSLIEKLDDNQFIFSFHDRYHPKYIRKTMWIISNTMFTFMHLFYNAAVSNKLIIKNNEIEIKLTAFLQTDMKIRSEIKNMFISDDESQLRV